MRFSRFYRRSGMTLVEVVVGLALMGSLLAMALVAGSSHLRQMKAAERKRESVELLDAFLSHWAQSRFSDDEARHAAESVSCRLIDERRDGRWTAESPATIRQPVVRLYRVPGAPDRDTEVLRVEVYVDTTNRRGAWADILVRALSDGR